MAPIAYKLYKPSTSGAVYWYYTIISIYKLKECVFKTLNILAGEDAV